MRSSEKFNMVAEIDNMPTSRAISSILIIVLQFGCYIFASKIVWEEKEMLKGLNRRLSLSFLLSLSVSSPAYYLHSSLSLAMLILLGVTLRCNATMYHNHSMYHLTHLLALQLTCSIKK